MFAVDLVFWCVTALSLLTLTCSILFVIYFSIRKIFEMLNTVAPPGARLGAMQPALPVRLATLPGDRMATTIGAGPWGPLDGNLSPEIAHKIERVMAIGVAMHDAAGNPCPHPIAPRVALAIVEALHRHA